MTRLVWTSIVSMVLGGLGVLIGIISVFTDADLFPLTISLAGASIALAVLALREE